MALDKVEYEVIVYTRDGESYSQYIIRTGDRESVHKEMHDKYNQPDIHHVTIREVQ